MNEYEINQINELLFDFIKRLPLEFLGNIYSSEELDYEAKVKTFLKTYYLTSAIHENIISHQYPKGTKLYLSNSKEFNILTNYEDHFLIIFQFTSHSLMKAIGQLEIIMKLFDKSLQELSLNCLQRVNFGFLTMNPNFAGLGISICYYLKLKEKGPNEMQIEINSEYLFN